MDGAAVIRDFYMLMLLITPKCMTALVCLSLAKIKRSTDLLDV